MGTQKWRFETEMYTWVTQDTERLVLLGLAYKGRLATIGVWRKDDRSLEQTPVDMVQLSTEMRYHRCPAK